MKRIYWNELFIKMAILVSQRSTCLRLQVGAVLVKDNRVISMGYNGTASNKQHCCDVFSKYKDDDLNSKEFLDLHGQFSTNNEIHAEMNAILSAAKNGINIKDSVIYCTDSPCIDCAKALYSAGIKKVFYNKKYDRGAQGIDFLINNDIPCEEVNFDELKYK